MVSSYGAAIVSLPPPRAPPIEPVGRRPVMPAATHVDTNARNDGEVEWNEPAAPKLPVDFAGQSRLRVAMDEDTDDLIAQLCTRAAMIMEDISELALTLGKADADHRSEALRQLERASNRISHLVQAALALED